MSALVGIVYDHEASGRLQDEGRRMMQALEPYPADDQGAWNDGIAFLGCHAQWITPQSVGERLPLYRDEAQLAITADAILDNRDELFQQLQTEAGRREQITDSELILDAYMKWGTDTPKHLLGDFAFLIWDRKNHSLFGARDLFGSRTLYYHRNPERAAFCTTITPLFAIPGVKTELDESWLAQYLAIPTMLDSTDIHTTAYKHINQIPASHSFVMRSGRIKLTRYGTLVPENRLRLPSNEDYEEAFRDVFEKAVACRLRTHRKVGATLSGGLDSGLVAGAAAKLLRREGRSLYAYSTIPAPDFVDWTSASRMADERPFIQETVGFVGNITENYLDFPDLSPFSEVDDWLDVLQAPYKNFENSHWIKGIYEEASRQGVGILLTGAAGNFSISWGSAAEYYVHLLRKLRWVRFYRELKPYSRNMRMGRLNLIKRLGKYAFFRPTHRSIGQMDIASMIHPDFAEKTNVYERLKDQDIGLESNVSMVNERESFFHNLAVQNMRGASCTKLSLRHSVWERDPSSDARVVRFCLSLPLDQFVQNGYDRSLIRRAAKPYLPDKVRLNQRTRGVQGADWLHRMLPAWGMFTGELHELSKDTGASAYLNIAAIDQALARIGDAPRPEQAFDSDVRFLMRSLIAFRFIKRLHATEGGETYEKRVAGSYIGSP